MALWTESPLSTVATSELTTMSESRIANGQTWRHYQEVSPTLSGQRKLLALHFAAAMAALSVCVFNVTHCSDILVRSVELTSILVVAYSHWLRITALLSSGCKATVEGLSNVHSSSTTHNDRATLMDGNCMCRISKVQSNFHFWSIKVFAILLFHIPHFTNTPMCGHVEVASFPGHVTRDTHY